MHITDNDMHGKTWQGALQIFVFHALAFVIGYFMTRASSAADDAVPAARCISLETGMQVSQSCSLMCESGIKCTCANSRTG